MDAPFTIHHAAAAEGSAVFTLSGRLDAGHAAHLKDTLKQAIDSGTPNLVVDVAEVPFIDSAGLSALVFGLKAARRAGGDLTLRGVQPQMLTILSLTMLDRVFMIRSTSGTETDASVHDRPQQPQSGQVRPPSE
jgi:anti-sigma B factor antagonist